MRLCEDWIDERELGFEEKGELLVMIGRAVVVAVEDEDRKVVVSK